MNEELLPNTNLSHYRIISRIGSGGMGDVFVARLFEPEIHTDQRRSERNRAKDKSLQ